MKWIGYAVSVVLILGGGVFFLQGMRVLPSQLMYGKPEWIIIGAASVVVGVALAILVRQRATRAHG